MTSIIEKIKNKEITVGDLVKGKSAHFKNYRAGVLNYKTSDGFEFSIPLEDTGNASFNQEHKAMELMRWIRKQVDLITKES